jgi:hypothetical protein
MPSTTLQPTRFCAGWRVNIRLPMRWWLPSNPRG